MRFGALPFFMNDFLRRRPGAVNCRAWRIERTVSLPVFMSVAPF
jgi:hypothetical protein